MTPAAALAVEHDPDPRRLETRLLDQLFAAHDAARAHTYGLADLVVVAPTRRLLDRLQEQALERRAALAGIEFVLHDGLAARFLRDARHPAPRALPPAWLATLFAPRLRADGSTLERYLLAQPAAQRGLLATFRDLRDSGLDAAATRSVGARASETGRATLELFGRFEELLAELAPIGFGDGAALPRAALATTTPFAAHHWFHYGAYELIGTHRALLARAARERPGTLFVPTEPGDRAARALLEACGATSSARAATSPGSTAPAARMVQRSIRSAATPTDEVRAAVRQLLAWHQRDGVPFREMALLVRAPDPYGALVAAEAALHDLPLAATPRASLAQRPAARELTWLLHHLAHPEDVLRARTARRHWHSDWPPAESLALELARDDGLAARLARLAALLPSDPEVVATLTAQAALATELGGVKSFAAVLDRTEQAGLLALAALEEASAAAPAAGAVQLLELHQARALPLRRALLLGANETLLPRRGEEDFFLPDADRRLLSAATGAPLALHDDALADERVLLDRALAGVEEQLVVSYARSNGDRELAPSPWLAHLAGVAPRKEALSRHPLRLLVDLHDQVGLLTETETRLCWLAPHSQVVVRDPAWIDQDPLTRAFLRLRATESYTPDALDWDGVVGPLQPRESYTPSELEQLGRCPLQYFFARELRVLPPDDERTSGELPAALKGSLFHRALEQLYAARFTARLGTAETSESQLRAELTARLSALLHEPDFAGRLSATLAPLRLATYSATLAAFAFRDLARLRELRIVDGEFERAEQRVDVGADDWPILLRMRLDRLLVDADGGEWVGDYKSGGNLKSKASVTQALRGRELQLALYGMSRLAQGKPLKGLELYSLAAAEEDDEADAAESYWLGADLEKLRAALPDLRDTLEQLMELRDHGRFVLEPDSSGDHSACGRCAYRFACRHSHGATRARAELAPEFATYQALARKGARKATP